MASYRDLLGSTFENKFSMDKFQEFIVQFFNNSKIVDPNNKRQDYWNWNEYSYYVNGFFHVADYTDPNNQKVAIFAVEFKKGKSLEKARSKQRNFIADRMKNLNYDGAITAFYSEDENEPKWRLSFVRLDYEFLKGKVKTNFTPAKRYSYLVGSGEPCHTAMQQLFPILEEEKFNPTIGKIEEAFSVEKVTKQFFEKYKEKYFELKDFLMSNNTFIEEAGRCIKSENIEDIEKFTEQFSKKLMGQIAFMYFLQKKGWMGVKAIPQTITETQYKNLFYYSVLTKKFADKLYIKSNENEYKLVPNVLKCLTTDEELAVASSLKGQPWGTGPKDFVRRLFDVALESKQNYFEDYLEPLFYEALNEKRPANNYYARLHCRIPFLNGGLFEPYYDWQHNNFSIPNEIFSNKKDKGERDADGILDVFDRYNFTMNEDEPLEKEIAVDPEMLGKIFENLLDAKDRKSKGAFYTPREIVHYMCQESLVNYLVNSLNLPYSDTKDFILYGEIMKDEDCSREVKQGIANMLIPETIYTNLQAIDNALADVRVADPAVGSGAFPMGMVNEIVKARDIITEYRARNIEIEEKKKGTSEKQINFLKAKEHELRNLYILKRDTMFNSIYAVDIEPSAVDIAKLRLWLSLVVEFEITADEPTPPTLPNLDCHILCGNSLIDEFEKIKLFDPKILTGSGDLISGLYESMFNKLYDAERKFFYAQNHEDKKQYREEIEKIKLSIIESALSVATSDIKERFLQTRQMASKPYTLWQLEFSKVFKDKGGFDIVIGNPPYVSTKDVLTKDKKIYEKLFGFSDDTYNLFTFKAYSLIKHKGSANFIVPKTFWTTQTKRNMRDLLLSNKIGYIFDTANPFESAMVDTCIFQLIKDTNVNHYMLFLDGSKDLNNPIECKIKQDIYNNVQNSVIFKPTELNLKIYKKFGQKVKQLYDMWWDKIKTSKDIEKNNNLLENYRAQLKPGDIALLGCLTEGGQGLATANNGKYIAVRNSTKWAQNIQKSRPEKLKEVMERYKLSTSILGNYQTISDYFKNSSEEQIVTLFDSLKEKYGRDIFGQGYLYRLISDNEIANIDELTKDEKENGIDRNKKYYVPYDKGDKDGNRWYLETPFAIAWSKENVQFLKTDTKARWQGYQFFFKEGFCWNDINTTYLKCRIKGRSINDVKSMSLYGKTDIVSEAYFVSLINSSLFSFYVDSFVNNTQTFQINDARQLPIIIPTEQQQLQILLIFNQSLKLKKSEFDYNTNNSNDINNLQLKLDALVMEIYGI